MHTALVASATAAKALKEARAELDARTDEPARCTAVALAKRALKRAKAARSEAFQRRG